MKAGVVQGCIALALLVSGPAQADPLTTARIAPDEFKW